MTRKFDENDVKKLQKKVHRLEPLDEEELSLMMHILSEGRKGFSDNDNMDLIIKNFQDGKNLLSLDREMIGWVDEFLETASFGLMEGIDPSVNG